MVAAILAFALISDDLDARMAPILPNRTDEKWLSIPWRTDLNQARADAQSSGKPLFMWIMNGHPMGCT
jgi:hypothetical protein